MARPGPGVPGFGAPDFAATLDGAGIAYRAAPVGDLGEGLYVSLHGKEQIERYVELRSSGFSPGVGLDVVGSGWTFIFPGEVCQLDSVEADRAILARCRALDPPVGGCTVMEMLSHCEFYSDILIHHEHGTMIQLECLHCAEQNIHKVTTWLADRGME